MISKCTNKILYIHPIGEATLIKNLCYKFNAIRNENTQFSVCSLPLGSPTNLEFYCYESLIAPYLVKLVLWAQKNNYNGIISGCFYDCQLREMREICNKNNMIITGPCESSCNIVSSFGNTFSVLVGKEQWIPKMKQNIINYGYESKLVSMRSFDASVDELISNANTCDGKNRESQIVDSIINQSIKCIDQDKCESIILATTCMKHGDCQLIQNKLNMNGYNVNVIDSVYASFKQCEYLLQLKHHFEWKHHGLPSPPQNEIDAFNILNDDHVDEDLIGTIVHSSNSSAHGICSDRGRKYL